ncbi:unnamed protein product [Triticum turgidum subsp. durum]|uniref:Disease resistance protein RPM1 n=1 Tax=Triticum turgidum subsp. durum TaxID=4567 RepID=A0A9R0ZL64_TRITD|nr:unnamed protein product [Triticum turgidum subsp. durum]
MADLAVGLSKTVVAEALTKVQSAIDEDNKLRHKAQRDLVTITLEFEMMQSFLNVANGGRAAAMNNLVRTWVRHVRELAYDLEDCVEFVVHLDGKPVFWRRLLPACVVGPLPLDQAVAEIEVIKGRAEELSACYSRYSCIGEPVSNLVMLQQQQASGRGAGTVAADMLVEARDSAKRQQFLGDLAQLITNKDRDLQVISVWGTCGDLGTTSIIRKAYNDPEICRSFACRVWVKLMHPFNPHEFMWRFMAQVYAADACVDKEGADVGVHVLTKMEAMQEDVGVLRREFVQEVNTKTYLVVLENLTDMVDWDAVRTFLPDMKNGSWIIVSTQQFEVASLCIGHAYQPLELKQYSPEHSVCAFFKEVHRKNPSSPLKDHEDVELEELILKCGGLPKVIVSIAALLATQTVTLMDTVRSLNQKFMQHLETNPDYECLKGLFDWMHSYFRTCPDSLKPCIFYLSIFPRHHGIRQRRLVRRWIAEGYSRDSDEESAVDKGESFFSKLLELSIIQQIPQLVTTAYNDTSMVSCQVNGFIREYIVSRRMEENLVFELGPNCVLTTHRTGRHLIILRDWDRDKIVFESIDFSRLRSLTVFGKWESFFISKSMRLLRVLDLEDALGVKDEDLDKMVKRLRRLKFLSVRGCGEIFHLPSSLGDLRQLQTLDVRHTSIRKLPASITRLQKLQYIRAGTTVRASAPPASSSRLPKFHRRRGLFGIKVPKGIGKLTALHTLGVVDVGASGGKAVVEELRKLTQLRKLGVSGITRHNSKDFFSATSGLVHLESLLVRLGKDSQGCLDEITLPWENLRSLTLHGLQDKLPPSENLSKLMKLDLEMDALKEDDVEFLGNNLPELCILRLRVGQLQDGKLHFHAKMYGEELVTFKKVKILEIASGASELHVTFGSRSMKSVELLKIDCSSASYHLTGLNFLSELKEVLLQGTNDEAIKSNLETQLANHPKAPTVKLEGLPSSS